MKVELWLIGKTSYAFIQEGMEVYLPRIRRHLPFELRVFPGVKNAAALSPEQVKKKEAEQVLAALKPADRLILFDERGRQRPSMDFALWLEAQLRHSASRLVFLVGGAWGFDPAVYQRAAEQIALSKMTFSHQIIRLLILEQLYRALAILRNEPYHHGD